MPPFVRCLFVLLVLLAPPLTGGAAPRPAGSPRLVGYVAGWERLPVIHAEQLSAINFAFAHVRDGAVVLDHDGDDRVLRELHGLRLRNAGLKILLSVGGWGADGFSDAALTAASRARFADSAADLVAAHALDGIDIDWEYPGLPGAGIVHRGADRRNFTRLLRALRERFDRLAVEKKRPRGNPYLLTAALADGEFAGHIELDRVHRYLDWVDLMTYDFHNSLTPTTGHHAALRASGGAGAHERSIERAVAQYLAAGVPARKLVVGVPFYGRAFAGVTPLNHGLDQPYGRYEGDHPWPQLVREFIDRNGYVRYWDADAGAPYLWNAQTRTFVSYDDPQSLKLKAAYVKAHRLGGMMYWEQSQDPSGELLDVLATGLRER